MFGKCYHHEIGERIKDVMSMGYEKNLIQPNL